MESSKDKEVDILADVIGDLFTEQACYVLIIQEANSTKTHYAANVSREDAVDIMNGILRILHEDPPDDGGTKLQ